nr:hypothetical protein GCM10020093_033670 [Planobispora longispora]
MVAEEGLADHVDLNFGCPVPKVTRRGGGSALPYKRNLLRAILREAVRNAGTLPVTMKMRKGIDDDHLTYLDAGRIAVEEGIAAVALHGRTAIQHYGGTADWEAIARLKEAVTEIPVLGNGDIWSADDALRMMESTGCDGVVVGRGCLGRPWLFRDLAAVCEGAPSGPGRRWARSPRPWTGTPRCWPRASAASSTPWPTSASTSAGTSRASSPAPTCAAAWPPRTPSPSCAGAWPSWTPRSPGRTG